MAQEDTELLIVHAHRKDEVYSAIVLNGVVILQTEPEVIGSDHLEKTLFSIQHALGLQDTCKIDFHMHNVNLNWADIISNLAAYGKIRRLKVQLTEFQFSVMELLRSLSNQSDSIVNLYNVHDGLNNFKSVFGKEIESITIDEIESCSLVQCIHVGERDSPSDKAELNIDTIFPADKDIKSSRNY